MTLVPCFWSRWHLHVTKLHASGIETFLDVILFDGTFFDRWHRVIFLLLLFLFLLSLLNNTIGVNATFLVYLLEIRLRNILHVVIDSRPARLPIFLFLRLLLLFLSSNISWFLNIEFRQGLGLSFSVFRVHVVFWICTHVARGTLFFCLLKYLGRRSTLCHTRRTLGSQCTCRSTPSSSTCGPECQRALNNFLPLLVRKLNSTIVELSHLKLDLYLLGFQSSIDSIHDPLMIGFDIPFDLLVHLLMPIPQSLNDGSISPLLDIFFNNGKFDPTS